MEALEPHYSHLIQLTKKFLVQFKAQLIMTARPVVQRKDCFQWIMTLSTSALNIRL